MAALEAPFGRAILLCDAVGATAIDYFSSLDVSLDALGRFGVTLDIVSAHDETCTPAALGLQLCDTQFRAVP